MSSRIVAAAMTKEIRALVPGFLASLVLLATAGLVHAPLSHDVRVAVYFLGATALGGLSMGHEYSLGTLSLLLSQPRRRVGVFLMKLGVLASMLLTLLVVVFLLGVGPGYEQPLVLILPVLCGLFIAPWLTMLCRNALAGVVFTMATPALVMLAGEIAAAVKFGTLGPTMAADANALKSSILWWSMFGISAVAAVSSWRLFMRLETIDGPGQAIRLPWLRERASLAQDASTCAKRHPVWLLMKKELRLQQLTFVVAGLYVLGSVGVWSLRSTIPASYGTFLTALAVLNCLAASVLAGSLASAEERQMGTLEWQALLPMSSWIQWAIKVTVVMGVALALGLGLPTVLASATGSLAIRVGTGPFLSAAAVFIVIVLSVMSLYISSLCATGLQALLWSVVVGFGLMTSTNNWLSSIHLGFVPGFGPFSYLESLSSWMRDNKRLYLLWMAMNALAIAMCVGTLGLLLWFARKNHGSAERDSRRLSRQLLSLGAYLVLVITLWVGTERAYGAAGEAAYRVYRERTLGYLTVSVVDKAHRPITNYTMIVFPEGRHPQTGRIQFPYRFESDIHYGLDPDLGTHMMFPGEYEVVAVEKLPGTTIRDEDLLARLKAHAIPLTVVAGKTETVTLPLSTY